MTSLEVSTLIPMNSNFFKVMNASGGVIGTWVSDYILDVLGRCLKISEGLDDIQRPQMKCWICLDVGNLYSVVLLPVYLNAACVCDTLNTELGKSWSFGHCHAMDRYRGPCMARLSVLSTFGVNY